MPSPPDPGRTIKPPSLLRTFSLMAFVSIAIFSAALALVVSRFIETRMLERDGHLTQDFVTSVAALENFTRFFHDYQRGIVDPNDVQFFHHMASMPDVIRANVYDPGKRLLWSSDPSLKGREFPDNDELDEALRGEMVVSIEKDEDETHGKAEHEHLSRDKAFVENYIPIRASTDGKVIGVVEFYREPQALFAAISEGRRLIWTMTSLGALALYLALFWIVRRGDAIMRAQQRQISQAETMSSLGELASMVAHNVRNPIASIRSSAELALHMGSLDKEGASEIITHVDRIEQSLRQVLAYATPNAGPTSQISLNDLLATIARDAQRNPNIQVELATQETVPLVRGDAALLEHALHSIVSNALDAMPDGGRLTLSTRTLTEGTQVEVRVQDTGRGIPQAVLGKVFDAFYTTKPKGMGLGLSLSRSIVRRYGGDIEIDSAPERGTRVLLIMPVA